MLLHDDIVTNGESSPVPSPARLVVKKGLNIVLTIWLNAGSVVPDLDFNPVAKALG